jgi:hypothetical protein
VPEILSPSQGESRVYYESKCTSSAVRDVDCYVIIRKLLYFHFIIVEKVKQIYTGVFFDIVVYTRYDVP